MAISYKEACEEVGYNPNAASPAPKVIWFAYKQGDVRAYENKREALEFSSIVERSEINSKEIEAWTINQSQLRDVAYENWKSHLRRDYPTVSDKIFTACLDRVIQSARQVNYDNLAVEVEDLIEFVINYIIE